MEGVLLISWPNVYVGLHVCIHVHMYIYVTDIQLPNPQLSKIDFVKEVRNNNCNILISKQTENHIT